MSRLCSTIAIAALGAVVALACDAKSTPPSTPPTPSDAAPPEDPTATPVAGGADDARGGRLYDRWTAEAGVEVEGAKRLKNIYGWDLRGADGIYGPKYQNKSGVSERNLLATQQSEEELIAWLSAGDGDLPGLGGHVDDAALRDLAAFISMMQRGELPGPGAFFTLSETAPKNYVLVQGADATRGQVTYADACAHCHGKDGTNIPIDETLSLGAFMRAKAYEGWFKILNGHPGSTMGREIEFDSAEDAAEQTLGIMAALCDRGLYPPLEGQSDVADDDPRCGAYLK